MSSVVGFGTMYYGWTYLPGGDACATRWVTAFYIPLLPLERHRFNVWTACLQPTRLRLHFTPLRPAAAPVDHFQIAEKTALHWGEVMRTYLKAFIGLPLLMGGLLMLWVLLALHEYPHASTAHLPEWFAITGIVLSIGTLANILWWPIWAIRQARSPSPQRARRRTPSTDPVNGQAVEPQA